MIFSSKPKIEILKEIDTTAYHWCNEALLIYVKNGLAALTKRSSEYDRDYWCKGQLLLEPVHIKIASKMTARKTKAR